MINIKTEKKMAKRISLDQNGRNKLNKVFSYVSRVTIWSALNWRVDSDLARKIRYVAIKQCGGSIVDGDAEWNWNTQFNTAEKTFVQTFGPRITVTHDEKSYVTVMYVDGVEKRREKKRTIQEYEAFQEEVERMAMSL